MSPLCQVTENVEWVEGCVHLLGEAVADEEIQSPRMIPRGFFRFLWVIEVSFLSWWRAGGDTQKWTDHCCIQGFLCPCVSRALLARLQ